MALGLELIKIPATSHTASCSGCLISQVHLLSDRACLSFTTYQSVLQQALNFLAGHVLGDPDLFLQGCRG